MVAAKKTKALREGANVMLIIGCDFHPGFQQIAIFDNQTGAYEERRLSHRAEAAQFYGALGGQAGRVGIAASGPYPWCEGLLAELGFEVWLGDAAKIRASVVRQQKTDRRDAEHLQMLMREDRFPRIWVARLGERSGTCGSCWCIVTSKCRRGPGPRTSCRRWP